MFSKLEAVAREFWRKFMLSYMVNKVIKQKCIVNWEYDVSDNVEYNLWLHFYNLIRFHKIMGTDNLNDFIKICKLSAAKLFRCIPVKAYQTKSHQHCCS